MFKKAMVWSSAALALTCGVACSSDDDEPLPPVPDATVDAPAEAKPVEAAADVAAEALSCGGEVCKGVDGLSDLLPTCCINNTCGVDVPLPANNVPASACVARKQPGVETAACPPVNLETKSATFNLLGCCTLKGECGGFANRVVFLDMPFDFNFGCVDPAYLHLTQSSAGGAIVHCNPDGGVAPSDGGAEATADVQVDAPVDSSDGASPDARADASLSDAGDGG